MKIPIKLEFEDEFTLAGAYRELYYIACSWWHRRCVSDYWHPPRRYRSWDMKASFCIYLTICICEGAYYQAWKSDPYGPLTLTLGYVQLIGLAAEHIHQHSLKKWRERTEES